ncbi:unnamed protein product [Calypogeia fissa]
MKKDVDSATEPLFKALDKTIDDIQLDPKLGRGDSGHGDDGGEGGDPILRDIGIESRHTVSTTAFRVAVNHLEGMAISMYLMRKWFSVEKKTIGNQILITLTDEDMEQRRIFRENRRRVYLPRQVNYPTLEDLEVLKVSQKISLSKVRIRLQQDLQKFDDRIAEGLAEVKRNSEFTVECITKAVEEAVCALFKAQN